jgi:hypothetical protein
MDNILIRRTYEPFKFLGRFFWVPLRVLAHTPAVSLSPTWQDSGEHWSPTLVVRIPLTKWAVGFGWWRDVPEGSIIEIHEDDAAYETYCAVNGAVSRPAWDTARRQIAAQGLDPDEEMELMQMMGVFE